MDLSRQELVIGKTAQKKLESKEVSIIGVGALGSLASELLVRSGIKKIKLFDRDFVEESNLQRQHLFTKKDVGKSKVKIAKKKLEEINPNIDVEANFGSVTFRNIGNIKSDLVLDCTDNMQTRFLLNDYCVKNKIPCIFSSAIQEKGYVFNFIPGEVCYSCIFSGLKSLDNCETLGVLNSITSLVSSLQVSEAVKILLKYSYEKDMVNINLNNNSFSKIKLKKNSKCKSCNGKYLFLEGKKYIDICKH